jgi:hypothetical protein
MDCFCLFTFYVAILSVMVEVYRIKAVRRLQPRKSSANSVTSPTGGLSTSTSEGHILYSDASTPASLAWFIRSALKSLNKRAKGFIGMKAQAKSDEPKDLAKAVSPAGRLKLCLVSLRVSPKVTFCIAYEIHCRSLLSSRCTSSTSAPRLQCKPRFVVTRLTRSQSTSHRHHPPTPSPLCRPQCRLFCLRCSACTQRRTSSSRSHRPPKSRSLSFLQPLN